MDAVGDNVLSSPVLSYLKSRWPEVELTIVCRESLRSLYEECPLVSNLLTIEHPRVIEDGDYLVSSIRKLEAVQADVAINLAYSREGLSDHLISVTNAPIRIAHEGDLANDTPELRAKHNANYTHLVPSSGEFRPEIERHKDLLSALGIIVTAYAPQVWTSIDDERWADKILDRSGFVRGKIIALVPCSQWSIKEYRGIGEAIANFVRGKDYTVLGLGSSEERERIDAALSCVGMPVLNLAGQTTLRQVAALLRRARMMVGVDTGTAHLAAAVGIPHVVILGGGHFGRFFPYSPLGTIVCLPLDCYLCNWECQYEKPYCISDISLRTIEVALEETDRGLSTIPRIFASPFLMPPPGGPATFSLEKLFPPGSVEVHVVKE